MQLLMPLLIKVACSLRYLMPMHNMKYLVPDLLAVARALSDKTDH